MKNKIKPINTIAACDRPREKFERLGPGKLTDAELLALILRTGTQNLNAVDLANKILTLPIPGAGLEKMYHLSLKDLLSLKGIGRVKAIQILAIAELSIRLSKIESREKISFTSPESIARHYITEFRSYRQEHLIMLLFDSKNHLIGERLISKGTVNTSMADPREIFVEALSMNAVSIVLIHNHPSGDPTPSDADILITERIFHVGNLIGVPLLDHIIVADNKYQSLREMGGIFPNKR